MSVYSFLVLRWRAVLPAVRLERGDEPLHPDLDVPNGVLRPEHERKPMVEPTRPLFLDVLRVLGERLEGGLKRFDAPLVHPEKIAVVLLIVLKPAHLRLKLGDTLLL